MSEHLSSGLDPAADYPILDPQADLTMGENHAFWFFDHAGQYSLLNCHIQGGGSVGAGKVVSGSYQAFDDWETRRIVFPIAGPGDELMVDFAIGKGAEPDGYSIGGWTFRCVEPFVRWTGHYRGTPRVMQRRDSLPGIIDLDGHREPVEIDLDFRMALPAWIQGPFAEDLPGREAGYLALGGPRYEQLCHVTGMVRRPDREDYAFSGTGIRTHRYGRRFATSCLGTSWLSAVWPSCKGFGSMEFLDLKGDRMYCDAFAAGADGRLAGIRVTKTPYLEKLDCIGRRFDFCFEGPHGPDVIEGEVLQAAYNYGLGVDRTPGALDFAHMMCRFRWNGEETVGMLEQGMVIDRLT